MGGDCLNTGCVPSKAFLKFSHTIKELEKLNKLGVNFKFNEINFDAATGSKPYIPTIAGFNTKEALTSENIFELTVQPKKLLIYLLIRF